MGAVATDISTGRQTGRLPSEVTSFVGRRHEAAEVKRMLSASRLVTLTGVGGVGKTRLALRVAEEARRAFPDGVWLAELAELDHPALLAQSLTEALEIRDHSSRPPMDVLIDHLRERQILLVLDNCEHLLHACALLTDRLLREAPRLRVLATSRQVLGIGSEQTLAVPTLTLPDPTGPRLSTGAFAQCDAVRLFTERARAVLPGFTVTETNRDAVEGICRRLDGIPLGIELAVVRLRALSVHQLLDRLDDRFRLLTTGSRAVLPRHQTLRALIDWSYDLCTEREQLLWARVSVFAGSLDLEAAEAVCSGDGLVREEILDLVTELVDKSVLLREEHGAAVRYRMLDTLRAYGRERLAAAGEETARLRCHRDYYRQLAADARAALFGPAQVPWFTRLQLEHANLRTALEFCYEDPAETSCGLGIAADLLYHWITSYYLSEGRRWLDDGLTACPEPNEVRARALWTNSWLAIIQSDTDGASALLGESREIGERLDLEPVLAYTALYSGMVAMYRGDADAAIALYEEAVSRHRATGDPVGLALALIRLSLAHSFIGDSPRAVALGEESLAVCDAYGEGWHRAYTMMALGVEVWRQGDTGRATALERESLTFNRSLDDPLGVGVNLEVLAWIAATEGDFARSARLLGVVRTVWRAVGASLSGYGHLVHYHEECEAAVSRALGKPAFNAAVKEGSRLSYDEGLVYALEDELPTAEPAVAERPSPLTRRESEIARLVAQGLSNKEIAASLVIAQRTAEGHIEHILSKLGFTSRAQVAVWVAEQGRATPTDGESPSDSTPAP
ncbi:ATP-binding protein [Streptomyces sp. NEAU-Y11]|uniref:ATP-binding protein n=1 Tax=Streptomyces cucumeris TaxID=2962890 RepID=UPI0020C8B6A8|nr:LuxR C-terminal-related transcriptional regulator [Streptomyces sp. NEAU-Y11]MCP9211066.1 LuxR C-terminal-related transcriptional regulator [Streptomyces sp. NEAU-Y11]